MKIHGFTSCHDNDTNDTPVILESYCDVILTHNCSCALKGRFLTLVLEPEAWFVLGMITVEIYRCLVRGGEKRRRDILAAESPNHRASIQRPIADFKEIMVGLGGEVKELYVGP